MNSFLRVKYKNIVLTIALSGFCSTIALATETNNTVVTNTEITSGFRGENTERKPTAPKYNRKPFGSQKEFNEAMQQETLRLNAIFQVSLKAIMSDTNEHGVPNMVLLKQDSAKSKEIRDVVAIEQYFDAENRKRQLEELAVTNKYKKGEATKEQMESQMMRSVFPIQTTMKPTKLPSRVIALPQAAEGKIARPMAVIGADRYSLNWFKANLGLIRRHNAVVIITQVNSITDLEAIRNFAPDLHYQPVDARDFLRLFGVSVYPVLVTNEGVLQ